MEQPATVMPMTKKEFNDVYWFSPLQMVTVVNPKEYDYPFMFEGRNYMIKAGSKEKIPGSIANLYLSQMTRIMAQDDDKMQYLSDYALMRQYYDKLIVTVDNLVNEVNSAPAYLSQTPDHMKVAGAPETPPWQAPESAIPPTNSEMKNTVEKKEVTKEFDLNGAKYKMTIDKNDKEMFFVDGRRIDAATYSKAASML